MNNIKNYSRALGCFLFIIGAFIMTITTLAVDYISIPAKIACVSSAVVLSAVLFIPRNKLSALWFTVLQTIAYILLATGMGQLLRSKAVFFVIIIMQTVISLVFMDQKIIKIQRNIVLIYIVFYGTVHCYFWRVTDPIPSYIVCVLAVAGIYWVCSYIAASNERKERITDEFERSQDELIRLIDAKCDEAKAATRIKSQFLSNMSHEIRTPLNSILAMNELILRDSSEDSIREYAAVSDSSGKLLLSIVNDILDYSKIESGKMEIIPKQYSLKKLLVDNVRMLERRFEKKGLRLVIEADESIPDRLIGDEMRIRQILTNIMSNALKYTDNGTVTLTAGFRRLDGESIELCLSVKDTGRGIKEEDKAKLFQTFSRVDEEKNQNIEGTGLGLAIAARLVDAMNGSITLDSTYEVGSVFTITIPQRVAAPLPVLGSITEALSQKQAERIAPYTPSFTAPEARILVTDDTPSNLAVVKGLLKPTGVRIDTAESGRECLELLQKNSYDLLLLDHMMPEMDGIETLGRIRELNIAEHCPVIALTANTTSGAQERYKAVGFDGYLAKPVSGEQLEAMLLSFLPERLISPAANPVVNKAAEEAPSDGITEIDRETGMRYCGGIPELYAEILETYCNQSERIMASLESSHQSRDIDAYRIAAHTVKSTSLSIGAKALSEEALLHENAAKQEDFAAIEKDYDKFRADFAEVIKKAGQLLAELRSQTK